MSINYRGLLKSVSVALFAQGVTMLVSMVTTLIVPRVLGVEEFGYWQLFIFYSSYVGFFHLGLNDGVYLTNGGASRQSIDKPSIKAQFLVGSTFQAIFGIGVLFLLATAGFGSDRDFVIFTTIIYMVLKNAALYLGYVFQAINETGLYSISCIAERVSFLLPLLVLVIAHIDKFQFYIVILLFSTLIQLVYCLYHARDFISTNCLDLSASLSACRASILTGAKLMFANVASMLILGFARFVIDGIWGIETFGKLSLALSLVNFFLSFVMQVSMVLFPELRRIDKSELCIFFNRVRSVLSVLLPLIYLLYFPLRAFICSWLPDYVSCLPYILILLPICVFDAEMNLASTTIFKVLRLESQLFSINLITALISVVFSICGGYLLHSVDLILLGSCFCVIWRNIYSDRLLQRELDADDSRLQTVGLLLLSVLFIFMIKSFPAWLACVVYLLGYFVFIVIIKNAVGGLFKKENG